MNVNVKLYIHQNTQGRVEAMTEDMSEYGETWGTVAEVRDIEIDFKPVPREKLVAAQVEVLRQAKTKVQADAQKRLTELDREIGKLLAIEAPQAS